MCRTACPGSFLRDTPNPTTGPYDTGRDRGRGVRDVIPVTNAIESLNARFRRSVKARGHFPNEQAALKCLYLTIISLDPTGRGRQRWNNRWKAALNAFSVTFEGRILNTAQ
jgi:putative transposase